MKIISSLLIGLLNWTTDGILGRLSDEQETIKHPSVVSGCVGKLFATKYKNAVDTIFYKIHFSDFLSTYRILLSNTL
jgi:hypothetical protein